MEGRLGFHVPPRIHVGSRFKARMRDSRIVTTFHESPIPFGIPLRMKGRAACPEAATGAVGTPRPTTGSFGFRGLRREPFRGDLPLVVQSPRVLFSSTDSCRERTQRTQNQAVPALRSLCSLAAITFGCGFAALCLGERHFWQRVVTFARRFRIERRNSRMMAQTCDTCESTSPSRRRRGLGRVMAGSGSRRTEGNPGARSRSVASAGFPLGER